MYSVFFEDEIEVSRLVSDIYNKTEEYQSVDTIMGSIRPINANDAFLTEGIPFETLKLFCAIDEDIQEGDKITFDSKNYIVKNIRKYQQKDIERLEAFITLLRQ